MSVMLLSPVFTDGTLVHQRHLNTMPTNIATLCQQTTGHTAAFGGAAKPIVKVARQFGTFAIITGTARLIDWDVALVDPEGIWLNTPSNAQLAVTTSGWYRITAQVTWASAVASQRAVNILINGTLDPLNVVGSTNMLSAATVSVRQQVSAYERLPAGATLYVSVYQDSGSTVNVLQTPYGTWLSMQWDAPY